jgi:mono/diheme cytochrome c family protein
MLLLQNSAGRVAAAVMLVFLAEPLSAAEKAAASSGQRIYDRECATCHGAEGKGDGETAAYLTPQPQDLTTGILQKRSDEFLTAVIAKGGVAKGLSESMPAFPKLSKSDVQSVVVYIRQLATGGAKKAK